ncbi:MAG: hypothetical protein KC457_03760 [Myxococcales bacterium]|nr:hypothetical protein [Myxococcales bacterium]
MPSSEISPADAETSPLREHPVQEGDTGGDAEEDQAVVFVDAATRVSTPSAFDDWYYGIEDKLGQGTIGMGVCLIIFLVVLLGAMTCNPI